MKRFLIFSAAFASLAGCASAEDPKIHPEQAPIEIRTIRANDTVQPIREHRPKRGITVLNPKEGL